jgi:hypothetical protein
LAETNRSQASESEAFLPRLLASAADCIKALNLDRRLFSINDNAKKLLELDDLTPLLGTCWAEWWNADRVAAEEAIEQAKAGDTGGFVASCPTGAGTPKGGTRPSPPSPAATAPLGLPRRHRAATGAVCPRRRPELVQHRPHRRKNGHFRMKRLRRPALGRRELRPPHRRSARRPRGGPAGRLHRRDPPRQP